MAKLVNLDRAAHRQLRVVEERAFSVFKNATMCPVHLSELGRLVIEYPLAFIQNEAGKFICAAIFGVEAQENLYWEGERWKSQSLPLNVGRQPFFAMLANDPAQTGEPPQLLTSIDLENPGVQAEEGEPLFDEAGAETPYLRHKVAMLAETLDAERRTREFVERVVALGLVRPFQLELKMPGAEPRRVTGLHTIDEKKLRELDAAMLAELNAPGYLHGMYAMISSLAHLRILMQRSAARRPKA